MKLKADLCPSCLKDVIIDDNINYRVGEFK